MIPYHGVRLQLLLLVLFLILGKFSFFAPNVAKNSSNENTLLFTYPGIIDAKWACKCGQIAFHLIVYSSFSKFACDTCGNSFLSKLNLEIHKRKAHLNDYRYCCEQCGKRYVCHGELNQHIKTHTKSNSKFQCEFPGCQMSFNRKPTLRCEFLYALPWGPHLDF